jgi:hypothetical protein
MELDKAISLVKKLPKDDKNQYFIKTILNP